MENSTAKETAERELSSGYSDSLYSLTLPNLTATQVRAIMAAIPDDVYFRVNRNRYSPD